MLSLAGLLSLAPALASVSTSAPTPAEGARYLGLSSSSYFFSPKDQQRAQYSSLTAHWEGQVMGPAVELGASARAVLQLRAGGRTGAYFEVPEAFVRTSRQLGPVTVGLGRKLEEWNHLDEYWRLGIWQPRFRWDYIRPESVGLTGSYLAVELPSVRIVGFASPLFIPERGADIANENGALSSNSPWFIPPPSQGLFRDVVMPVSYSLVMPPIRKIILRPSAGILLRTGAPSARDEGPWASAGLAWKPMNQLLLGYEGKLQLTASDTQEVAQARIYPRVAYHRLVTAEVGYNSKPVRGWISTLHDQPSRDLTPSEWSRQEAGTAIAFAPALDFQMPGVSDPDSRMELSYLQVQGGRLPDTGSLATGKGSVFDGRYPFQQAVIFGLRSPLSALGRLGERVSASTRLLRDLSHPGSIFSAELSVRPAPFWNLQLGADILGSDMSPDSGRGDFISRYRANDRFYGGVSYVF